MKMSIDLMNTAAETIAKPQNVKEIVAILATQFPLCFSLEGPAKPLKVGIFQDLVERLAGDPQVSKTMLRQALRVYTSSWRYLESVTEGTVRVDLDGQPGAPIDAQQAAHAQQTLLDSKAKAAEARKAKQAEARAKAKAEGKADAKPAKSTKKPADAKSRYKKTEQNQTTKSAKNANLKSKPAPEVAAVVELIPLAADQLKVGAQVQVRFGSAPIKATIVELAKSDVVVQLSSGMVVKTQIGSIFQL
jgi:ProP effector